MVTFACERTPPAEPAVNLHTLVCDFTANSSRGMHGGRS